MRFLSVIWPACMSLGLNVNCFCFLNFNNAPLILDDYFKLSVSGHIGN
jgi:hypothetical protein